MPVEDNPDVQPTNCSACEGTCWDRGWSKDGNKCEPMRSNIPYAKSIGPCHIGCDCVPPAVSYNQYTHSSVACCKWGPPMGSCDGKKQGTEGPVLVIWFLFWGLT